MHIATLRSLPVIGMATMLALSACSREPEKTTYTVDDYFAKPDLLQAKLHECADNPGDLRNSPDCVNVKEAVKRQGIGSYDKLPPLRLSKPGAPADTPQRSTQP